MKKILITIFMLVVIAIVIASPNQPNENPVGYEYLDNETVIHIWNENDDYYFDADSAIQLTNNYDEYWTRNVFCGAYKTDSWHYSCTDDLPIELTPETDDETYVKLTGYRDVSIASKTVRFTLTYYLEAEDEDLTIEPSVTNLGTSINKTLGFAWKVTDIQISMDEENDFIEVDDEEYTLHDGDLDETYDNLEDAKFTLFDTETNDYLYLTWNENLNYLLKVKNQGDYNANVMLLIRFNGLDVNQTKSTKFNWLDKPPIEEGACNFIWNGNASSSYLKLSDGQNAIMGGYIVNVPGEGSCLRELCDPAASLVCKVYARTEGSSDWVYTGISTDFQDGDCNASNFADGFYDLIHDNKTDFRIELWSYNGYGDCNSQSEVMPAVNYRLDIWDNEHTPFPTYITLDTDYYGSDEDFTCNFTFFDEDGDSENISKRQVHWSINDDREPAFDDTLTIYPENTSMGQSWKCYAKVYDDVFTTGNERYYAHEVLIGTNIEEDDALDDTSLREENPDTNYGGDTYIHYCSSSVAARYGIYKFDLSSIPTDVRIGKAELYIYAYNETLESGEAINLTAHQIYSHPAYNISGDEWNEGTATWNNKPGSSSEYNNDAESSWVYSDEDGALWMDFTITDMVKDEFYEGDDNISIYIKAETASGTIVSTDLVKTRSQESTAPSERPYLLITYLNDSRILDDTSLREENPDTNYGSDAYIHYASASGATRYGIYKFDLSSIPYGANINEAKLYIYAYNETLESGEAINLTAYYVYPYPDYNISGDEWNEGTATWNNMPTSSLEYNASAESSWVYSDEDGALWMDFTVTDMVKDEFYRLLSTDLHEGDRNISIYIKAETASGSPGSNDYVQTRSKESSKTAQRPYLEINYKDKKLLATDGCDLSTAYNNKKSLVRDSSNRIHVVYSNCTDALHMYSLSQSAYVWSEPHLINDGDDICEHPSLAINSSDALFVICDWGWGSAEGTFVSTDLGVSWTKVNDSANYRWPDLTIDSDNNLHVVARWPPSEITSFADIFYRNSSDGGVTWSDWVNVSKTGGMWGQASYAPSLAIGSDGMLYLAYEEELYGSDNVIYFRNSSDGVTWSSGVQVSGYPNNDEAYRPSIAVTHNDDYLYIAWHSDINTTTSRYEIYFSNSSDGGVTWSDPQQLSGSGVSNVESYRPAVTVTNGTWFPNRVYVIWYTDEGPLDTETYYRRSDDGGVTWFDQVKLSRNTRKDANPSPIERLFSTYEWIWTYKQSEIYYSSMNVW